MIDLKHTDSLNPKKKVLNKKQIKRKNNTYTKLISDTKTNKNVNQ